LRIVATLLASTALAVPPIQASDLPTGGQVVSGSVSIDTTGSAVTITQGSDRGIVNWNGFSIGAGKNVNFVQPGAGAAILNRVTGDTPSTIAGSLTANGQVFLINPNGIAITSTGTVKAGGGFVASTLGISNEDFLSGQYRFEGDGTLAGVSNEGIVTIGRGGYTALIGGTVRNDGLIAVPMGKVGLGSGEQATLDLSGDGFLQVAVPTGEGAEGKGALIENGGTISADGGTVVMKAATARNTARQAINLSGVVEASSISGRDGEIVIGGGESGSVAVTGKITAKSSTGKGGKITVTGKSIELKGATVDASGAKGGGSVKIGGDRQGKGTTQRAASVKIDPASIISADATQAGTGGTVVVWSDELTTFAGQISARGAGTGTGGEAEVSGKAMLDYTGVTSLSGPGGFGNLLLDPYNVTISSGTASNSSGATATGNDSVINVTTLQDALAGANVTVSTGSSGSQNGDILVATALSWSANTTLTLAAAGTIAIDANITATGASAGLVLTYGGTDPAIASGASVTLSGTNASLSVNGNAYTLVSSASQLTGIGSSGLYAISQTIDLSGTTYTSSPISTFSGTLLGLGHTISNLAISNSSGGNANYGLIGRNSGTVRDLGIASGSISVASSGTPQSGLLIGQNTGTVYNASSTGTITAKGNVGGLVGQNIGTIRQSSSTAAVTGSSPGIGGLVGTNAIGATITTSYAGGTVVSHGNNDTGGLVGQNLGTISSSHAYGATSGTTSAGTGQSIGGLAGWNSPDGTISYSYALGSVTSNSDYYMGGLVGTSSGTITSSYSTGTVTATTDALKLGGLVGWNNGTGSVTSSFWDTTTSGTTTGVGMTAGTATSSVTGLTTTQARTSAAYTGWDFSNDWYQSGDMRPILRAEAAASVNGVTTVSNLHQLALMGSNLAGSYSLATDIDASLTAGSNTAGIWSTSGWVPVGTDGASFAGSLDGHNEFINNLTIVRGTSNYIGLFGKLGATASIANVSMSGSSITGYGAVGSLVGWNEGTISYASASGTLVVAAAQGGLTMVNGSGGLVGFNNTTGVIQDSFANVTQTVNRNINAGGFLGQNAGTVQRSYASGSLTGTNGMLESIGGLVGYNHTGALIADSFSTASIASTNGYYVGGLVGYNRGTISRSYTIGAVSGVSSSKVGGFAGGSEGTITASYWNTETAGTSTDIYDKVASGALTGLSTSQMRDSSGTPGSFYVLATAAGWNFDTIWVKPNSTTSESSDGQLHYAELYGASGVVRANSSASTTYGDAVNLSLTLYGTGTSYRSTVTATPSFTTSATATSDVGTYSVSGTGGTVTTWANRTGRVVYSGSVTISAAMLTVTAANGTSVYGDTPSVTGYSVSGWKNSQTDSLLSGVSVATNATATSNVGTGYTTTASGGTLSGAASGNYSINYVGGSFAVTPATLTVTAANGTSVYGDTPSVTGYSVSGWKNSQTDSLLTGVSVATNATATSSVGTGYTTTASGGTLSGAASGNYSINYVGSSFAVTPATLTVTAANGTSVYGDTPSVTGYSVSGWKNSQADSLLTGISVATNATATSSVGTGYTTTASGGTLSGAASGNYSINYVGGSFAVTPATLTVTAANGTSVYGDTPSVTGYSVSGWKNSQADSLLTGISVATNATATSSVGTGYTTTASGGTLSGAASGNYSINYVGGGFAVTPATLTVTAANGTSVYGDTPSVSGYSVSGWKNSQTDSLLSGVSVATNATATSNVGTGYTTTASGGTLSGAASGNYSINYASGSFAVTPATLTVTAANGTSVYGDTPSVSGYSVSGWKNSQADSLLSGVSVATNATATSNVGTGYTTTASGGTLSGAASGNYSINYASGSFAVTPATLTVTAANGTLVSGSRIPTLAYSVSSWKNGQSDSLLSGISVATNATTASSAGTYRSFASGGTLTGNALANYVLNFVEGTVVVTSIPPSPATQGPVSQPVAITPTTEDNGMPPLLVLYNPASNLTGSLGLSPLQTTTVPASAPQIVLYTPTADSTAGGASSTMTTEHPQLSGAVCSLGPNFAIDCSAN
jgi:filamentous hemagglutinin family protein